MKNLIASLFLLGAVSLVSCGPTKNAETSSDSTTADTAVMMKETETMNADSTAVKSDSVKMDSAKSK